MKKSLSILVLFILLFACGDEEMPSAGNLQITSVRAGTVSLSTSESKVIEPVSELSLVFSGMLDPESLFTISLSQLPSGDVIPYDIISTSNVVRIILLEPLNENETYQLSLPNTIRGINNEEFLGTQYIFKVAETPLEILSLKIGDTELRTTGTNDPIDTEAEFTLELSHDIDPTILESNVFLVGSTNFPLEITRNEESRYTIKSLEPIEEFSRLSLLFSSSLGSAAGKPFESRSYTIYTQLDGIPDFPIIPDEDLLTKVQEQTFKYFYDFAQSNSGLARERNTSGNTVTSGGSGFGMMALIVGVERGFISREEALSRWERNMDFLESAERFHGAWSHWLNGNTGEAIPFSPTDNGGDIVETAFLVQGMLTVRQYLNEADAREKELIDQITKLWEEVEWSWYTKGGEKRIYWHWSPEFEWAINLPVSGHNETQIIYTLAAASPTFPIDIETYENGYARNGGMQNGNTLYGVRLPLGNNGPLFFTHYSYLGMDPRNLEDKYANYWEQNISHSLINWEYCKANPRNYIGYSEKCWGLTASDNFEGYSAHSPNNDLGVITPTAAISSIPYTPDQSIAAIKHFYYDLGHKLWGPYGFYDAFAPTNGWVANSYLAIDQGPIILMIENYRTGLLWDLFMSAPEVSEGLDKLEFSY